MPQDTSNLYGPAVNTLDRIPKWHVRVDEGLRIANVGLIVSIRPVVTLLSNAVCFTRFRNI